MQHNAMRSLSLILALLASPVNATIWGVQATNNAPYGNIVTAAQALGVNAYRIRIGIPWRIMDTNTGQIAFASTDVNPYGASPGVWTLIDQSGNVPSTGWALNDPVTSPMLPGGTTISVGLSGGQITVSQSTIGYINSPFASPNALGAGSQLATVQANAGSYFDCTVFNLNGTTRVGSGPILTSDSDYRQALNDLFNFVILTGHQCNTTTAENEEDGSDNVTSVGPPVVHNGDSSTEAQYLTKLQDLIAVAHSRNILAGNGGLTTVGTGLYYYMVKFYVPPYPPTSNTTNTLANEQIATQFQTYAFTKSQGQANFSNRLPNECDVSKVMPSGKATHASLVYSLLTNYATMGMDFLNLHWYQTVGLSENQANLAAQALVGGLPLMYGEVGTYSKSYFDAGQMMSDVEASNAFVALWWDANNNPNSAAAIPLQNLDGSINTNGQAYKDHIAGTIPGLTTTLQTPPNLVC